MRTTINSIDAGAIKPPNLTAQEFAFFAEVMRKTAAIEEENQLKRDEAFTNTAKDSIGRREVTIT
jgi:hypothetical protein